MGWYDLSDNQTISFANLRDASQRGVFQRLIAIANTNEQVIKTEVTAHVSVNTSYAPFADLTNLQLPVKSDLQSNNGCPVSMPFFCQKNDTFPPPATVYDPTKDFVYTYNMGGVDGGLVAVTLSGMTRNLANALYPGEVYLFYGGQQQMSQINVGLCFNVGYSQPAVIEGVANPSNRTIYFAGPPILGGMLTLVISCGGANPNFTLSGTVAISCVDTEGYPCSNGTSGSPVIYFPPGGLARFLVQNVGEFNVTINQVGAANQVLGIYNSSGALDDSIGPIDSTFCGTHSVLTTDSSYYEIREISSPTARPAFVTLKVDNCPVMYVNIILYGPDVMAEYSYYNLAAKSFWNGTQAGDEVAVNTAVEAEVYWYGDLGGYLYSVITIPSGQNCDSNQVYSGDMIDPNGEYFDHFSCTLDPSAHGYQVYQTSASGYSHGPSGC